MGEKNQPDINELAVRPETVGELWALDGTGAFFREVSALFLASIPNQLAQLRASLVEKDASAITKLSHQMKSSSGNLGATFFSRTCARVEEVSGQNNLELLPTLLDTLDAEFARVRASLETEIRKAA